MRDSLALLARQTGISIGAPGALPNLHLPAVTGTMEPERALHLLLDGTPWRAVRVGGSVWRIEPVPPQRLPPPRPAKLAMAPEIIVTARKRGEPLATVPAPVIILPQSQIDQDGGARDTRSVAQLIDGLTVTNFGSGRNRLFVRGIADSPFDGFGQASVSVELDETRATYDAPDPDLRLVDLEQVELLKGPQGPLYGTGALGGVYRLVTNKPDLAAASASVVLGAVAVAHGGPGQSLDLVGNVPLIADRLGIRGVAYRVARPGWIDNGARADANRGHQSGGRIALQARPSERWTFDLAAAGQWTRTDDSQYVVGERHALRRPAHVAEPLNSSFETGNLTVRGRLGLVEVVAVSSLSAQATTATYDASSVAPLLGVASPALVVDRRRYRVLNQELRAASDPGHRISWLAGLSALQASTDAHGDVTGGGAHADAFTLNRQASEIAAFGEAGWHLAHTLKATVGLRVFRAAIDDERDEAGRRATLSKATVRLTPSATLSWDAGKSSLVYLRYASALRSGGIGLTDRTHTEAPYHEDELRTVDLGGRVTTASGRLSVDGGLFASRWTDVQADFLRPDGLVTTHNAGNAGNFGLDVAARWRPRRGPVLDLGVLLQRARIDPAAGLNLRDDRRLPVVPRVSARAALSQSVGVAGWSGDVAVRVNYIGSTRLSFDPVLDRKSSGFALLSAHLEQSRGPWTVRVDGDNLADSRADSFAFGNPFAVRGEDEHTPLRPRSLTVSIARHF